MKYRLFVRVMMMAIALLTLVIIASIATDDRLIVRQYTTDHISTKHELTFAIITDLHGCFYGDGQHELIKPLQDRRPDVILLGGDIYDDQMPHTHTDVLLSQLTSITPHVYYVNGNHELYLPADQYAQIEHKIKSYGIGILHGDGANIPINNQASNIHIYGVSDPVLMNKFHQELRTVGASANPNHLNILLAHRPEHIGDYLHYPFDVIISGHAHGGQWRIPMILNGLFAPNQGLFPKYAGGEYHFDNAHSRSQQTQFIVSRGLAKESTRYIPRIFNRPELVFLTLNADK